VTALDDLPKAEAPQPAFRLIPSRFPPVGAFDTVATPADLEAVMELEGWTNDRLVLHRLRRLPQAEWVFGRANASVVMAAFLHASPVGGRFNGPELGAWYASATLVVAVAEVGHHLRREAVALRRDEASRDYRCYGCRIGGRHVDLRSPDEGLAAVLDPLSWSVSQALGERLRAAGSDGILYPSLRHRGGENVAVFRPSLVGAVSQREHLRITVRPGERRISVQSLS
jgi:RES domain-containing protein